MWHDGNMECVTVHQPLAMGAQMGATITHARMRHSILTLKWSVVHASSCKRCMFRWVFRGRTRTAVTHTCVCTQGPMQNAEMNLPQRFYAVIDAVHIPQDDPRCLDCDGSLSVCPKSQPNLDQSQVLLYFVGFLLEMCDARSIPAFGFWCTPRTQTCTRLGRLRPPATGSAELRRPLAKLSRGGAKAISGLSVIFFRISKNNTRRIGCHLSFSFQSHAEDLKSFRFLWKSLADCP